MNGLLESFQSFPAEGPESRHHEVAWHAPMTNTFHAPERFGLCKLVQFR